MPDFEIDSYNAKELAYYLYAFKENLDTQSNYIVKSFKNTKIENATHISDIGIMLGYGKFTYNLDENTKIIIKHEQKGQPVGTTSEAIIYEKLTVCCDTFEIWEKFRIEINTFLSKFDKSDTNKLNIYVADKYGDWYKYSKIMLFLNLK